MSSEKRRKTRTDRSNSAFHAGRVASRAVSRYLFVDAEDEIDLLTGQLERIEESEDDGTSNESDAAHERDVIKRR